MPSTCDECGRMAGIADRHCAMVEDLLRNDGEQRHDEDRPAGHVAFFRLADAFDGVPQDGRMTHPGSGRHAGSTLDYIFFRGCRVESPPKVVPALRISDHDAVFVKLKF